MILEVGDVRLDSEGGVSFSATSHERSEVDPEQRSSLGAASLAAMSVAAILLSTGFSVLAIVLGFWPFVFPALLFAALKIGTAAPTSTADRTSVPPSNACEAPTVRAMKSVSTQPG